MSVMTHIAPPVYGCVVTPIITRVALCVIIFFGCCTYIINLSSIKFKTSCLKSLIDTYYIVHIIHQISDIVKRFSFFFGFLCQMQTPLALRRKLFQIAFFLVKQYTLLVNILQQDLDLVAVCNPLFVLAKVDYLY